jgi:hypothetical protein
MESLQEIDFADCSDDALMARIRESPRISDEPSAVVRRVSPCLLAKPFARPGVQDEIAAIRLAEHLNIRVPNVLRVVDDKWFLMEYINGATLLASWPQIGWFTAIRLALQLRHFVRALRTLASPTAGGLTSGICDSLWLDDYFEVPPHSTPQQINSFFAFWLQYSWEKRRVYPNVEGYRAYGHLLPPQPTHFAFCHSDLAPRNLLVDEQENLWVLDWQRAGYYPKYFEYVGMQNFFRPKDWGLFDRLKWWLFSWISVGIYERERMALELIRGRALSDSFARCVLPEIRESHKI